jgi:hypothetical protein
MAKKSQVLAGYALRITNAQFRVPLEFSNPASGGVDRNISATSTPFYRTGAAPSAQNSL